MMTLLIMIASVLSAYLVGAFPTSFIVAKALKGIDIRQFGSKNVGATNVVRVVGKGPGAVTLIVDILKGILVVTFITNFFYQFLSKTLDYEVYRQVLGLVAICGHIWPVFLRFRGGKGIATTLGVTLIVAPKVLIFAALLWIAVFVFSNYVSLASIAMMVSMPIMAGIFNEPFSLILFTITTCVITCYKHKDNIRRLLNREEHKIGLFKN